MRKPLQAVLIIGAIVGLAAAAISLRREPAPRATLRYQHSLEYPAYQPQELLQVGSLDRG